MKFKQFYKRYAKAVKENPESPFLIHFRVTSVGATNIENCHPFKINDSQVFVHNGTIHKVKKDRLGDMSDTRMFNQEFLQQFPVGWQASFPLMELIEDYIGTSKLIILNLDGSYQIANEKLGNWSEDGGIWWSNYSYKDLTNYNKWTGRQTSNNRFKRQGNAFDTTNKQGAYSGITEDYERANRATALENLKQARRDQLDKVIAGSTIPNHSHSRLEMLESDDILAEACDEEGSYETCDVCDVLKESYLVTTVMMDGAYYNVCPDCIRTLDCTDQIYYEYNAPSLSQVYADFYPDDEDIQHELEEAYANHGILGAEDPDVSINYQH